MKLQEKTFFALLAVSMVLIIITTTLVMYSFRLGLQDYVNERQQRYLTELAEIIERDDLFDHIVKEPKDLHHLWHQKIFKKSRATHKGKSRKSPLLLLDNNKNVLAGRMKKKQYVYAGIKQDGRLIGFIALPIMHQLIEARDINFLKSQQEKLWLLALAAIMLSALFARLVAPHITRPIIEISKYSQRLREQKYSSCIGSTRKDEIGELANNMDALALHLETAEEQRKRWLASTSHELRTPLAILKAEIEALLDGIREPDEKRLVSLLDEVAHLQKLTEDLQQLNRSVLSFNFEIIDLTDFLQAFEEKIKQALSGRNIQLDMDVCDKAIVNADKQRLQQLVDNLLQNSIRYTGELGKLAITLTVDKGSVQLVWQDSAPGVSNEDLQHLLEYLYRGEKSRNKETGGFGLGLAIVADIVKAHDATIRAEHSKLGGLKLTIAFGDAS